MNPDYEPPEEGDPSEPLQSALDVFALRETPSSSMFRADIAARSHQGNGRPGNDGHYLVVCVERSLETMLTNLPEGALPRRFDETVYGMLVADGLGSLPAGEMASAMALCKIVDLVVNSPDWIMKMDRRKATVVKRRMSERFHKVDMALREHGEKDPRLSGMATTLTVACSLGADLFLGHVGDSRAYLLRGGELHQLTRDHTLAQALIDAGVGEAENALVLGMRRVLTSALGTTRLKLDPQVEHFRLCHDDQLLLCTGGLTETVEAETIKTVLLGAGSADEACGRLIEIALSDDNVTAVIARYRFPQPA